MGILRKTEKRSMMTNESFLEVYVESNYLNLQDVFDKEILRNSDVFTAIKIISSDIASLDLKLFKNERKEEEKELNYLLNKKPNSTMNAFDFKFQLVSNVFLSGESFVLIIRDLKNKPLELRKLNTSSMSYKVENGDVIYEYNKKKIDKNNILHIKFFTLDGISGISPLFSLVKEIDMIDHGNKALLSFFKNGVKGSGILNVKSANLNKESKQKIREKFEEVNTGDSNNLRTIVLDETMDYKPIEVNTKILELVNNNKYSTRQIAKVFGIPADRFGQELVNTSTVESNKTYLNNTLKNYLKPMEEEFTNKLIDYPLTYEFSIKFDVEKLIELSDKETMDLVSKGIQNSLFTINEGRAKLKLGNIEGGDVLLKSLNFIEDENIDEKTEK
jgi:HK97 family phage portal protein